MENEEHRAERCKLDEYVARKRAGHRAFVAKPNTGAGTNRSVVIIGSAELGWFQAVKCWEGDHRARATALADAYNSAPIIMKEKV